MNPVLAKLKILTLITFSLAFTFCPAGTAGPDYCQGWG